MNRLVVVLWLIMAPLAAAAELYVDYEDVPQAERIRLANQHRPLELTAWGSLAYVYGHRYAGRQWRFLGLANLVGHGALALSNAHVLFDCASGEPRADRFFLKMVGGDDWVEVDMPASRFGRRTGCRSYAAKGDDWAVLALQDDVFTRFSGGGYYALLVDRRFSEDELLRPAVRARLYLALDYKRALNLRRHCTAAAPSRTVALARQPADLVFVGCPGIRDGRSGSVGHYRDAQGYRRAAFTIQFDRQRRTALDARGRLSTSIVPSGGILFGGAQRASFERLYVGRINADAQESGSTTQSVNTGSSGVDTTSPAALPGIGSSRADRGF